MARQGRDSGRGEPPRDFESQLGELQEALRRLERGDLSLDDSLSEYERGRKLLASCEAFLEKAERKIEMLTQDEDGAARLQDFRRPRDEG